MGLRRRTVLVVLGLLAAALVPLTASPPAWAQGTVTVSVQGQGSVTGSGIDCTQASGDCSEFYADEEVQDCDPERKPPCITFHLPPTVTLTASAGSNGFVFQEWMGACDAVSGRDCTLTVDSDTSLTARFRDAQAPSVAAPTPASGVRRGTITLATTASDNAGVTKVEFYIGAAKLGEDGAAPYELSWNTMTGSDGAKSITAKAYDAAGNVTTSAASGFTVDNTAPTVVVDSGPDAQTFGPGGTHTWTFMAHDATTSVSVACSLVASGSPSAFGACSGAPSSHSVTGLPGGSYDFAVRVTDGGGLTTTSAPRTFTIDDVAPGTSVTSGPAHRSRVRARSVTFGLGSTEPDSTFACRVSPAGVTPPAFDDCTAENSHTASGLANGTFVFQVVATDPYGNVDATPVSRQFTVDTVAPRTSIRSGPPSVVRVAGRTARAAFTLASERGARYKCKLDARKWTRCTNRPAYTVGLGAHTLRVVAVDLAGNADRTPAVRRWTVRRR